MYLEIQKLVIEHPHLGDPAALSSDAANPEHVTQYDAFAFVVWNFIESIYDFTGNSEDPRLTETWQCIIDHEGERHVRWFVQPAERSEIQSGVPRRHEGQTRTLDRQAAARLYHA